MLFKFLRRMNILHVCSNYYPSKGGPQYTLKNLSEKLIEKYNDQVEVITTNSFYGPEMKLFKVIEPSKEMINKVQVNRMPFHRWHYPLIKYGGKIKAKLTGRGLPYHITKLRWGIDSPAMIKAINNSNTDVIMATTINYNFCDYPFWRNKTFKPKPFILYGAIHLHNELKENNIAIKRARVADCYISNTEYERRKLISFGISPEKIVNIGTGISIDKYKVSKEKTEDFKKKYGIATNDITIGYVGRLVKGKGVSILIDSFRKTYQKNKNLKLLLAGSTTEYVSEIKKIIQEEQLPILLIENFEDDLKSVIFHSIDIFVLASQSESFGVVFLEAWACKKPVVGSRMGATECLLTEGDDGLLFELNDPNSLTVALETLIKDSDLQKRLGENGYQKILNNYTWEKIVSKYREAYLLGIENFRKEYL